VVSAAKPQIANYHFTTLTPNLGVVSVDKDTSFVMADIPGIIEGASRGVGLGHEFMRHIDRCRLLVHLVDVSGVEGRNPIVDFEIVLEELKNYSKELFARPQIVVANKIDLISDYRMADELKQYIEKKGYEYYQMSAVGNQGIKEVVNAIAARLSHLEPIAPYERDYIEPAAKQKDQHEITITKEDGAYIVEGEWLCTLLRSVNMQDYESLGYFQRVLKKSGVIAQLEKAGAQDGDIVIIYDLEFDFVK
jgi:GTP-binding protein